MLHRSTFLSVLLISGLLLPSTSQAMQAEIRAEKSFGPFSFSFAKGFPEVNLKQATTIAILTVAGGILLMPIEYRLARWVAFKFKSQATIDREARELVTTLRRRYEQALVFLTTHKNKSDEARQASFKKTVMTCYQKYHAEENGFLEFCRRVDWLNPDYGYVAKHPYTHLVNRLDNGISWLRKYQGALPLNHELQPVMAELIFDLQDIMGLASSCYEYVMEQNMINVAIASDRAARRNR